MTINPSDYDLDELDSRRPAAFGKPNTDDADGIVRASQFRELLEREAMADEIKRPYLITLPETYGAELLVFEWLGYLHDKAGFRDALEAIRYYRSITWIGADIEDRLEEYLRSFDGEVERGAGLDVADHRMSLMFIARLAAMD